METINIMYKNNEKETEMATGVVINTFGNGVSVLNFYLEHLELPDTTKITISDEGVATEDFSNNNNKAVREIKAKIALNIDTLRALSNMLMAHISQFDTGNIDENLNE